MKGKRARFGTLVARYYSTIYSFASRLTDDPREAVLLTHEAFTTTRKKLRNHRSEAEFVTTLLGAIIGRGFFWCSIRASGYRCMMGDYQRERQIDSTKGDPPLHSYRVWRLHEADGGYRLWQLHDAERSCRRNTEARPSTKARKNAVQPKRSRQPKRKLSLAELSSLCRLTQT